jgi:hypothetical protein
MTFDPQEAPENFLALISPDCQQQSLAHLSLDSIYGHAMVIPQPQVRG